MERTAPLITLDYARTLRRCLGCGTLHTGQSIRHPVGNSWTRNYCTRACATAAHKTEVEQARLAKLEYLRERRRRPDVQAAEREYRDRPDVRDKYAALRQARRAKEQFGPEDIRFTPAGIFARDNYICQICRTPLDMDASAPHPTSASIDHIIPISKGGRHCATNVQSAHLRCNLQKGAKEIG